MLRSLLFVPGDSDKKLAKAESSRADALILDLEDAVAFERLPVAREMVRSFLSGHPDRGRQQLWVRINPLVTPLALADLAAIMPGRPDGILLPKSTPADVATLDHYLSALEVREGLMSGKTRIMSVSTETPEAVFRLLEFAGCSTRLAGLTWGAEDLSTAIGASTNRDESGEFDLTFRMARSLCLLAAANAGVQAIDTLTADFRDEALLSHEVRRARRAGFTGKIAIHPAQVDVINAGFAPDEAELAHARRIVEAFAAGNGAGAVQVDGKMVDKPHLTQAMNLLSAVRV